MEPKSTEIGLKTSEIVERVLNKGHVEKITVSRSHKHSGGDLFLSKTTSFVTPEDPEGLSLADSNVASILLSKDVEIDLTYRALASKLITSDQAKQLVGIAQERFSTVAAHVAKGTK